METLQNFLAIAQITLFAAFLYNVARAVICLIKENKTK